MTEAQFRQQVLDLARVLGWECYFSWTSLHSPRGFPDLVLCRPPRLLFVELKTGKRRLTPPQAKWLKLLEECSGIEVYAWYPTDFEWLKRVLDR